MKRSSRSRDERTDGILALILLAVLMSSFVFGYLILQNAVTKYVDRYQLKTSAEVLTPPFDRPLVEGNELYLTGQSEKNWKRNTLFIAEGERVLIAGGDEPLTLKVNYVLPTTTTPEGLWRGEEASMTLQGVLEVDLLGQPGNASVTWGSTLSDTHKNFRPYFTVSLPIQKVDLRLPWEQRTLQVSTWLAYTAPGMTQQGVFKNGSGEIEHQFELVVLTPEEVQEYLAIRSAERSRALPGLILGIVLAVVVNLALIIVPLRVTRKRLPIRFVR